MQFGKRFYMNLSLESAQKKLKLALKRQLKLKEEIQSFRKFIQSKTGKPDLNARNKQIYSRRKLGISVKDLSLEYNLSIERIRFICAKERNKELKATTL